MIHYNTKNVSFLKVAKILKDKGIKNYAFFLVLYDESLANVDPYDENLTDDQKNRIIIECTKNPWYFLREVCKISGSGLVPYNLHLGNLAFTWAVLNNFNTYMVLPRQNGKTTAAAALIYWFTYFGGYNTEQMLFANSNRNLINNMGRVRNIRENLPQYMQLMDKRNDRDGSEMITFKSLGNKILKQAPKRSEEGADSVGRGFSTPVVWYDEFAFIPHIKTQYQASVLAQTRVAKQAAQFGLPHSIMITTTAAFLNTDSGIYAYNFLNDCLPFDESFYDKDIEEINKIMSNEAKRHFISIVYDYWDLGVPEGYFEEQCEALNYDKDAIDREVLNKWKAVSTTHPLGQETVARLEEYKRKPVSIVVLNNLYRLKLYKDPNKIDWSIPYVIGGDCSDNLGGDYSALIIVDPRDYSVIGTLRSNSYSTTLYAKMVVTLMTEYFYKSILVMERNRNGSTMLDIIVDEDFSLMQRIYAGPKNTKDGKLGIDTTEDSRYLLYSQILRMAVNDSYDRIYDETIITEIKNLIRTRTGRIDHPVGGHDDCCISWLFARWFLMFGENIERYIDPLIIGTMCDIKGKTDEETERLKKEKEREIKEKIMRENEQMLSPFRDLTGNSPIDLININGRHASLNEQNRLIRSGILDKSSKQSSLESVFGTMSDALIERYNPKELSKNAKIMATTNVEEDKGKILTLDPNEMEEDDSLVSEEIYNKNPKDISFNEKAKPIQNNTQFERSVNAQLNNNDFNSELNWFMRQFK